MIRTSYQSKNFGRLVIGILTAGTVFLLLQFWPSIGYQKEGLAPSSILKAQADCDQGNGTTQPRWLIATMSEASRSARRSLIRETWQTLYASPIIETRFVLAGYNESWTEAIERENSTYGDLIRLENVPPGAQAANTIKTIEYFKYLATQAEGKGRGYDFVTKLDDDAFLVAAKFYTDFLAPRLQPTPAARTIIARRRQTVKTMPWPQGSFYTLSWDMVVLLAQLHSQRPVYDRPEDVLVGKLLYESQLQYDFVELDNKRAFDIAGPNTSVAGKITGKAVAPHMLKDDVLYTQVASLFDEDGWNGKKIPGLTDLNWKKRLSLVKEQERSHVYAENPR